MIQAIQSHIMFILKVQKIQTKQIFFFSPVKIDDFMLKTVLTFQGSDSLIF